METTTTRPDGTRPSQFSHIYNGKFVDRSREIKPAGILTYAPGDNVEVSIRQQINSAPVQTASTIEKFRNYTSPGLGAIKLHYGHADDSKAYESMTHGMQSDKKSFTAKDCVNPRMNTRFEHLRNELNERAYGSNRSAPLGRVPLGLVSAQKAATLTFGVPSRRGVESAKECLNPDKPRHEVEIESSDKHEMYVYSHSDYEPGEQTDRVYSSSFDPYVRFGETTRARHDGKYTKDSLNWTLANDPKRLTRTDTVLLDKFRNNHTSQLGTVLDPNKETRFLGPDHVFGLNNQSEVYTAGDVIHYRSEGKTLKGRDRERAYLVTVRSNLARYNIIKFKTLVDAFKFYDKDKDGFISKEELKVGCVYAGCPVSNELLELVLNECDYDQDGRIGFLEFCNFLCYKDSMKTGIDYKASDDKSTENIEIRDDEGRFLLYSSDLVPKYNIATNALVPRTLVKQIDEKRGNWKTTYDIINDAPFRSEPTKKRVYGIPSIRTDILPPAFKKIQDKTNYGNDGNAWALLVPSVFSQHGVYENDVLKPRPRHEIHEIMKNSGLNLSAEQFEQVWSIAERTSLTNSGVSVEDFRSALNQMNGERRRLVFAN